MVLYINCCVRKESRTDRLARAVLKSLGDDCRELKLYKEGLKPLDEETLLKRTALIESRNYTDPMFRYAKEFASADTIVIAAPYWDLSFPSMLKVYFENIYVTGIVSEYSGDGTPRGLCRAKDLYYVTTAGGPYEQAFSYGYVERLSKGFLGIRNTHLIKAEMLDVAGSDPEEILQIEMKKWETATH